MKPAQRDDGEDGADTSGITCPTCGGSGRQPSGRDCPACDGLGIVTDEAAPQRSTAALGLRRRKAKFLKGTVEHRAFEIGRLECRSLDDGTIRMTGYGSVTEYPYEVNGFTETIKRGAFRRTLSESPDVVLLYGHEGMPLARTKAGSLALEENARGLHWTADLDAEDPDSRAVARKVERGLIDQCSFAFLVTDQDFNEDFTERTIKAVSIHRGDVSLVAMGANPATSVEMAARNARALAARAARRTTAPTMSVERAQLQQARDRVMLNKRSRHSRSWPRAAAPRVRTVTLPSLDDARRELDALKRRTKP